MLKILVVEDDPDTGETIQEGLERAGHQVEWVETKAEGQQKLASNPYDMIVLDWNLGRESGLDLCAEYRSQGGRTPILMLTGKSSVNDKVAGLDHGADDYLVKPFSVSELNARIAAILRKRKPTNYILEKFGDLELDYPRKLVIRKGEEIALPTQELAVLGLLMRNADKHFTSAELLKKLWSAGPESNEQAVQATIASLRKLIDTSSFSYVSYDSQLGYRIASPGMGD
ncbi:MAG: response regulator transcription factor [Candidatus Obscuribacterales bacterium]|nr:response regulator transcription factor [Candidatus Obscuribacterales bacterium]